MGIVVIRTIETKLAIAENNGQHEMRVSVDSMKYILALLKEQEKRYAKLEADYKKMLDYIPYTE